MDRDTTFKRLLESQGITGYHLAIMSGYPMSGVYRLISGERDIHSVKMSTMRSFADVLCNGDVNKLLYLIDKFDKMEE